MPLFSVYVKYLTIEMQHEFFWDDNYMQNCSKLPHLVETNLVSRNNIGFDVFIYLFIYLAILLAPTWGHSRVGVHSTTKSTVQYCSQHRTKHFKQHKKCFTKKKKTLVRYKFFKCLDTVCFNNFAVKLIPFFGSARKKGILESIIIGLERNDSVFMTLSGRVTGREL